jgi:hypothetical protein
MVGVEALAPAPRQQRMDGQAGLFGPDLKSRLLLIDAQPHTAATIEIGHGVNIARIGDEAR